MAEVTQAEYEEMQRVVRENDCAECGAELQIRTNPEQRTLEVGCPIDRKHHGYIEKETLTEAHRRGAVVPSFIEDRIKRRMLPEKADLDRVIALVATRFPRADLDHPSAATFILDCWRLDLDPLLGEIVPVTFKGKGGRKVVTPVITEDGWLSLAARGCPEEWLGPPRTEEVTDPDAKEAICNDRDAWVYLAYGYTKKTEHFPLDALARAPGWLTKKDWQKAKDYKTPAGDLPGNQARVRAIKRWVRENFPQARHNMILMTQEWMGRAEGVKEAQEVIDAEYRILGMDEGQGGGEGAQGKEAPAEEVLAEEISSEEAEAVAAVEQGPGSGKEAPAAKPGRDPSTIKCRMDFEKACFEDFKLQPKKAWQLAGTFPLDVADYSDLYLQVKAKRE